MVSGTGVRCRTVDPQISITHSAAEDLRPIVCIPELSGTCWRGYQVSVCSEAEIRSQAEVVVIVIRDSLSKDQLKYHIVVRASPIHRKATCRKCWLYYWSVAGVLMPFLRRKT